MPANDQISTEATHDMSVRPVLLVGSIPLADAAAVFDAIAETVGNLVAYVPDGETGERANWIGWQFKHFSGQDALEQSAVREREYQQHPPLRLKPAASGDEVVFGALGFAAQAIASYELFYGKRAAGAFPKHVRFQVAIPTPFAPVYNFVAYESQSAVQPLYAAAIRRELDAICQAIPHGDLAIQWDVATEMSILENVHPAAFEDHWETLIGMLAALGAWVPENVTLGYHLCYGSMGNKHWKEPDDLGICVEVANALAERVPRSIDWFHMPVPIDRDDDAYAAPLAGLRRATNTRLYLGLVHDGDGVEGARRRVATASKYVEDFGISSECGLGRRTPAEIPDILRLHMTCANRLL